MKSFKKLFLFIMVLPLLFSCNNNNNQDTKTYNVTLNANGGTFISTSSDTKTITGCSVLARADLEEPTLDNAGFKGWYLDSSISNAVTFPYTLDKNITMYAGWSAMPTGDFTHSENEYVSVSDPVDNVYTITITAPSDNTIPTITLSGCLNDAELNFDIPKKYNGEIDVILNNFKITSTDTLAPMVFTKSDSVVNITSNESTANFVFDKRTSSGTFDDDGAISAKSNLKFNGSGSLYINDKSSYQGYSDAIYSSKNVTIENTSLKAYGTKTAIKGKRSISINDAVVTAYSKTGSGLKTSDEDVQDNKRCGDIAITGDTALTIATAQHGISASHDLSVNSNSNGSPKISVYTSDYAKSYVAISTPTITEKDMYIYLPTGFATYADQNNYRFAVLFSDGSWDNATLKKYHSNGKRTLNAGPQPTPTGGTEGYYFGLDRPIDVSTCQIVLFNASQDENPSSITPGTNCVACTSAITLPSSGDTAKITAISESKTNITCDGSFGTYDTMIEKGNNTEKASYGCKGLTAGNEININAGTLNIKSKDDAIHSKYGKLFPAYDETFTRTIGTGNLNINGDNTKIYITSADDAIHGTTLNIGSSGSPYISIATCYEGLEAAVINYANGLTSIYARDDGVNGANIGNIQGTGISINVSGGYLDVQVASGDTDGIDSNNTYTQTGGIVVSRASNNNNMSTALDTDGAASVTNSGVFVAVGVKPEANISSSKSSGSISKSFSKDSSHIINNNNSYSFKVTMEYSQYYYYLGNSASIPSIS